MVGYIGSKASIVSSGVALNLPVQEEHTFLKAIKKGL